MSRSEVPKRLRNLAESRRADSAAAGNRRKRLPQNALQPHFKARRRREFSRKIVADAPVWAVGRDIPPADCRAGQAAFRPLRPTYLFGRWWAGARELAGPTLQRFAASERKATNEDTTLRRASRRARAGTRHARERGKWRAFAQWLSCSAGGRWLPGLWLRSRPRAAAPDRSPAR